MIEIIQRQHVVSATLIVMLSNGASVAGYSSNVTTKPFASSSQVDHGLSSLTEAYKITPKNSIFENEQVAIIHRFASNLIENIEDFPPEYSEIIDEHFWELI